jgi:hypothetical protein
MLIQGQHTRLFHRYIRYHYGKRSSTICILCSKYIVTDLINALPGNSYVNTFQHATIDEAVLSMSSAPRNSKNGILCDQLLGYATVLTIELCFLCGPSRGYITRFPETTDPSSRQRGRPKSTNPQLSDSNQDLVVLCFKTDWPADRRS